MRAEYLECEILSRCLVMDAPDIAGCAAPYLSNRDEPADMVRRGGELTQRGRPKHQRRQAWRDSAGCRRCSLRRGFVLGFERTHFGGEAFRQTVLDLVECVHGDSEVGGDACGRLAQNGVAAEGDLG